MPDARRRFELSYDETRGGATQSPVVVRAPTRAADVYDRMRGEILEGRLTPGMRLKFQPLCANYQASVGAIREALARLVSESLVSVQPRQGYSVAAVTQEDLTDLVEARVEIESLALRMSVEHGDVAWEAGMVAAHHVLEKAPFRGADDATLPSLQWQNAHRDFHLALIAACPNKRLLRYTSSLRTEAVRYQMWSITNRRDPARDRTGEHRALLDAAMSRDAALSDRLIRAHLLHTASLVLDLNDAQLREAARHPPTAA